MSDHTGINTKQGLLRWRIPQRHSQDCGIAVLAMLANESYDEVLHNLLHDHWMQGSEFVKTEGKTDLAQPQMEKYLTDRHYFLSRVYDRAQPNTPTPGLWPPEPFAYKHFAIVTSPDGGQGAETRIGAGHYVAVNEFGQVYDPLPGHTEPKRLTDWEVVNVVVGLVRYIHVPGEITTKEISESTPLEQKTT